MSTAVTAADIAAQAGPGVGYGLAALGALRFIRWLVEFIFVRLDIGRSHLGKRLRHLEEELDNYREATMLLLNALVAENPANEALRSAAALLRKTPRATLELNELEARLRELN